VLSRDKKWEPLKIKISSIIITHCIETHVENAAHELHEDFCAIRDDYFSSSKYFFL